MENDTAPAWDDVSSIWVLAYELKFPGEEGRWPQAARRSFNTEAEARAYVRSVKGAYQICRVELPSEVTTRADALREALKIARDAIPTASPPQTDHYGAHVAGERAAAERIVQRLAALIPAKKEPPHGE